MLLSAPILTNLWVQWNWTCVLTLKWISISINLKFKTRYEMWIKVHKWTSTVHSWLYLSQVTSAIDAKQCIPAVRLASQQLSILLLILKATQPLITVLLKLFNYCRVGTRVLCRYHKLYSQLMLIALTEFSSLPSHFPTNHFFKTAKSFPISTSRTQKSTAVYIHTSPPHTVYVHFYLRIWEILGTLSRNGTIYATAYM